jgi:hypothetical protein
MLFRREPYSAFDCHWLVQCFSAGNPTVRLTVIGLSNPFPQGTLTTRLSEDIQKSDGFNPTSGCDAAFACDGSGGVVMAFQVDYSAYDLLCNQETTPVPSSALELTAAQLGGLAGGIAGGAVLICVVFYFGAWPLPLVMTDIHTYTHAQIHTNTQTHKHTNKHTVVLWCVFPPIISLLSSIMPAPCSFIHSSTFSDAQSDPLTRTNVCAVCRLHHRRKILRDQAFKAGLASPWSKTNTPHGTHLHTGTPPPDPQRVLKVERFLEVSDSAGVGLQSFGDGENSSGGDGGGGVRGQRGSPASNTPQQPLGVTEASSIQFKSITPGNADPSPPARKQESSGQHTPRKGRRTPPPQDTWYTGRFWRRSTGVDWHARR